ncbi:MAG: isoprenylcysteine carboxylmethyltransferase family protein [Deltaproteobacteria bacterium]|nr:isoprenylcysteine carboxylmethyltransferase family protein [Deltaproteobacteria bacterium]
MFGFFAFLILLALMGAARVGELLVARRLTMGAAARGAEPKKEPIFVVMVLLHVLPFVLAPLEVIALDPPFRPALFVGCACALLVLAGLRVWTLRTLGAMWNVRIVEPAAVVVAGPYRFIRHPNYAIVVAELFVLPLAHGCWVTMIILSSLNALVLFFRIRAEERVLFALPGYAERMGPKKRFIPGVFLL